MPVQESERGAVRCSADTLHYDLGEYPGSAFFNSYNMSDRRKIWDPEQTGGSNLLERSRQGAVGSEFYHLCTLGIRKQEANSKRRPSV